MTGAHAQANVSPRTHARPQRQRTCCSAHSRQCVLENCTLRACTCVCVCLRVPGAEVRGPAAACSRSIVHACVHALGACCRTACVRRRARVRQQQRAQHAQHVRASCKRARAPGRAASQLVLLQDQGSVRPARHAAPTTPPAPGPCWWGSGLCWQAGWAGGGRPRALASWPDRSVAGAWQPYWWLAGTPMLRMCVSAGRSAPQSRLSLTFTPCSSGLRP